MANEDKKIVIKGIAKEAKIGLEVDGIFLSGLSPQEIEKYKDKMVEVTGYATEEPNLVAAPYKKGEPISQGFAAPPLVMRKIVSIRILEE